MFNKPLIAPSLLSADFMQMKNDVLKLEQAGADWMHVDVMDGHFVPNITMGVPFVQQLKKITSTICDAHLMVSNPLVQIPWFLEAGADYISFHIEAMSEKWLRGYAGFNETSDFGMLSNEELDQTKAAIHMIHSKGAKAAIAIKPKTPLSFLNEIIEHLDMVLIMSVEPGFSGQGYIEGSDLRVAEVVSIASSHEVNPLIQVDGGINPVTANLVGCAGADVFVSGNYILKADDIAAAISGIRDAV